MFPPSTAAPYTLKSQGSWPEVQHRFDKDSIWALRAAIAAKRPLLLRGEPGIGKSQLARAAAHVLGVPFLYQVVHERTERDDLLYTFDAVARLARAQLGKALDEEIIASSSSTPAKEKKPDAPLTWNERMAEKRFVCPGVLWWAFNWESAEDQARDYSSHCRSISLPEKHPADWQPGAKKNLCGPVVLIDEIDKADPSVPNGLLESLGNEGFSTPQLDQPIRMEKGAKPPLIIITTNEERELPAAFLRRCLVLQMHFPHVGNRKEVNRFLIEDRARVNWTAAEVSDKVCLEAIDQLLVDRKDAEDLQQPKPGAAEFLDVIRALVALAGNARGAAREKLQLDALQQIHGFAYRKNLNEPGEETARQ